MKQRGEKNRNDRHYESYVDSAVLSWARVHLWRGFLRMEQKMRGNKTDPEGTGGNSGGGDFRKGPDEPSERILYHKGKGPDLCGTMGEYS